MTEHTKSPKERAVEAAGGVTKLADALSITRSAVSQWDQIPMDRVFEVSRLTNIPAWQLRPDRIPPPQPGEAEPGIQLHEIRPGICPPPLNAPCTPSPDSTAGRADAASPDPILETSQSLTPGVAGGSVDAPADACG